MKATLNQPNLLDLHGVELQAGKQSEIAETLTIGERLKKEGDQAREEFWKEIPEINFLNESGRTMFLKELSTYDDKRVAREKKNKKLLKAIQYDAMSLMAKKKFEKEYIKNLVLYQRNPKIKSIDVKKMKEDEFLKKGLQECSEVRFQKEGLGDKQNDLFKKILKTLEKTGGLKKGSELYFQFARMSSELVDEIAQTLEKTGGLKAGSTLNLGYNQAHDDGAKSIAAMLQTTGGLKEGSLCILRGNGIGDEGAIALAQALENTGGLKIGSVMDFHVNHIGDEGAKSIVHMLKATGGLKEGCVLNLQSNDISDDGVLTIIAAIQATGGMKYGSVLDFEKSENIGEKGKKALRELQQESEKKGIICEVLFDGNDN